MELADELLCVFSARVEEADDAYVVRVPERELSIGDVRRGGVYRIAILPAEPRSGEGDAPTRTSTAADAPVEEGEVRTVDIEDVGDQGDGIARVDRGFVIVVPDTERGERVTIEITDVRENVGFGDVVEREAYYE